MSCRCRLGKLVPVVPVLLGVVVGNLGLTLNLMDMHDLPVGFLPMDHLPVGTMGPVVVVVVVVVGCHAGSSSMLVVDPVLVSPCNVLWHVLPAMYVQGFPGSVPGCVPFSSMNASGYSTGPPSRGNGCPT